MCKKYSFILSLIIGFNSGLVALQTTEAQPTSFMEQKQNKTAMDKAKKWFGGIALAATALFAGYQGVQYGHGKYIESTYAENKKYKKYKDEWDYLKEQDISAENKVQGILSYAYTPEDVDMAERFFQAQEGYIFAKSPMVQKEIKFRRDSIKREMERAQQKELNE